MKHAKSWLLYIVFSALLAACSVPVAAPETNAVSGNTGAGETRTVIDVSGAEVEIPANPQRIAVAWDRGITELIAAAELPLVAAASMHEFAPFLVEALNDLDGVVDLGSHREINLEALALVKPDLIFTRVQSAEDAQVLENLQQIAPTVQFDAAKGVREMIADFGDIVGQEYADKLNAQVDAAVDKMAAGADVPGSIIVSNGMLLADSIRLYKDNSNLASQLMAEAGFGRPESQISGSDQIINDGTELSFEELSLLDGDILFLGKIGTEDELSPITSSPLWESLDVVQNDTVIETDWRYWNVGGPLAAQHIANDFVQGFQAAGLTSLATTDETTAARFPVTIEHKFGSVIIEAEPQRVVSLGYSEQDPILALGVTPIAVRDWFGDQPFGVWPWAQAALGDAEPTLLQMPYGELNYEQLASLQPDLFVATHSGITEEEYEILSQIAPVLAQSGDVDDFGMAWQDQTMSIGLALGQEAQAEGLIADVEAQIAAAASPNFTEATIAWITPADGKGEFWAVGDHTPPFRFFASLGLGASSEIAELIGDLSSLRISSERLDLVDTSILVVRASTEEALDEIKGNTVFQQLNVVQEDRVIYFVGNDPVYGALSFSTILSLPYVVEELVPQFSTAINQ